MGECGLHVHIVKFDPICADGACTGWNYMSAPEIGKKMVYRWWADEEFGVIFFHDHLFANYRQKHGLFGALLVEPAGATFHDPYDLSKQIITGQEAVIMVPQPDGSKKAFREFCLGIQDWTPLFNRDDGAIQPPDEPGAHDDNGVMAVNYRCEPLRERPGDPAYWFHSTQRQRVKDDFGLSHEISHGDPATPTVLTPRGANVHFRLVCAADRPRNHSFTIHGHTWPEYPHRGAASACIAAEAALSCGSVRDYQLVANAEPGDYAYHSGVLKWAALSGLWGILRVV